MLIFTNNSLIQTYFATNYHEMYIFIGFVPDRVFYLFFFHWSQTLVLFSCILVLQWIQL